jgi:hypothetical protein
LWLLTAYIIGKLAPPGRGEPNGNKLYVNDLIDFIFSKLWKKAGVVLNDSVEELEAELRFLAGLGYIDINDKEGIIITKDKLSEIVDDIEKDPLRGQIKLWDEYIKRINSVLPREDQHGPA